MKTQIRKSCFETNSSSMHAIVITNSKPDTEYIEYRSLNFIKIFHPYFIYIDNQNI